MMIEKQQISDNKNRSENDNRLEDDENKTGFYGAWKALESYIDNISKKISGTFLRKYW